ncbi:MAG: hypothetical protein ACYDIE_01520 [Candidatus Krumholzibacteriia bacterium]
METSLIGPASPLGNPAPYWFLVGFKALGLALHLLPMHLWYAGILVMLLLRRGTDPQAARLSDRIMSQMPVIVAVGVNLGIVPLLFTQVAYYRAFYPAGVLMAWPWFMVIPLLCLAYYGVYAYAFGVRAGRLAPWRVAAGRTACAFFIAIGWLFANLFALLTNVPAWRRLWAAGNVAGAPLGLALDTADPTLWPRWLMMFGLAVTTTAAWVAFDTGVFAGGESPAYRRWARGFALRLHTVGIVWFAAAGSWYVFGALDPGIRARLTAGPLLPLTALTALGPGLVWLLILAAGRRAGGAPARAGAIALLMAQFLVLALNVVSRQIVQNRELRPFLDVTAEPVRAQTGPLLLFLALFVAGLGVVVWMLRQAVRADRTAGARGPAAPVA